MDLIDKWHDKQQNAIDIEIIRSISHAIADFYNNKTHLERSNIDGSV